MAKRLFALCALLVQAAWIQAAPAESTELGKPRGSLRFVDKYIVAGEYVDIEQVPYQLSLTMYWMHTCGAAIISENYALTAAHCNMDLDFFTRITLWLTAGSTSMLPFNFGGSKHFLAETWTHPKYETTELDYDIAILKVTSPFKFGKSIQSVPLPPVGSEDSFLDYSQKATVSGWGVTTEGNLVGAVWLKKADLGLVAREECSDVYLDINAITKRMICAGGEGKGGSCQGDSGGPVVHKGHLIGLVSWGLGCNRPKYPGVYANLFDTQLREFIKQKTGL